MSERFAVVLELLEILTRHRFKIDKRLIQKAIYIFQTWLKPELNYGFKLNSHGLSSDELTDELENLKESGFIKINYDSEWKSYCIESAKEGLQFLEEYLKDSKITKEQSRSYVSFIKSKSEKDIQLIADLLYFNKLTVNETELSELMENLNLNYINEDVKQALSILKKEKITS